MNKEELFRKKAEELIRYDLRNEKLYRQKLEAFYDPSYFWALALGFLVVMNLAGLIFRRPVDLTSNVVVTAVLMLLVWLEIKNKRGVAASNREAHDMEKTRAAMAAELDRLNAETGLNIAPWWNCLKLGDTVFAALQEHLEWAPFTRTRVDEDGVERIAKGRTADREITGAELFELCEDPEFRFMVNNGVEADKTYGLAELVVRSESEEIVERTRTKSVDEVEQEIADFSRKLDEKERERNYWEIGRYVTDDTRNLYGAIGSEAYSERLTRRINEEMSQRDSAYKNRTEVVERWRETEYWYRPVGFTLLDEAGNFAAHILYKTDRPTEIYHLVSGWAVRKKTMLSPLKREDASAVIHQMWRTFTFGDVDPIAPKAAAFTDKEWAYWVYAFYYNKK